VEELGTCMERVGEGERLEDRRRRFLPLVCISARVGSRFAGAQPDCSFSFSAS
jgi:hypothetical protein